MIFFLPLEISITKYQTSSSELLETLNQYVKCQQDIAKYIPCTVKERSPDIHTGNVTVYQVCHQASSESSCIKIQNLLKSGSLPTVEGNYQDSKIERIWDIALSWLIYYLVVHIINWEVLEGRGKVTGGIKSPKPALETPQISDFPSTPQSHCPETLLIPIPLVLTSRTKQYAVV